MINAWGSSDNGPTVGLKRVVRIKTSDMTPVKGTTNLAKKIRENILRDEFGYTDADIREFNEKHPADLVIEDSRYANKWALDEYVKGWKAETDGLVPITLEDQWVTNVMNFLTQRASFEVFKTGIFFTDAALKNEVLDDLENLISASGEKRVNALNNLMNAMAAFPNSRPQLYKALKFLTNESGYKNNPFLMIALAGTTAYKSDVTAMGSSGINQAEIANTVRMTNELLYNNSSKSPLSRISRAEAAQINFWAGILYDNVNANNEATNRRWIERYLSMSDAERNSYKEGDLVSIANSSQNAVRGDFPSERRLKDADQAFANQQQQWADIDSIGKDQSFDLKGDQRQTEYFQGRSNVTDPNNPTSPLLQDDTYIAGDKYERIKKPRGTNNGYTPKIRNVGQSRNVYDNVMADGATAPLSLYLEHAKWWTANQRMKVITEYLNKKKLLEIRARRDNVNFVPPPPAVLEQYIKELQRDGRITVNPLYKTKIFGVLSELRALLELSYAFYKKP